MSIAMQNQIQRLQKAVEALEERVKALEAREVVPPRQRRPVKAEAPRSA